MARRRYTRSPIPKNAIPGKSVGERLTDAMEIVPICGRMKCPITLWGNRQIVIEDVRELLYIDENMISIGSGKGTVQITGGYLTLCSIDDNCVVITGEISSVDFAF